MQVAIEDPDLSCVNFEEIVTTFKLQNRRIGLTCLTLSAILKWFFVSVPSGEFYVHLILTNLVCLYSASVD